MEKWVRSSGPLWAVRLSGSDIVRFWLGAGMSEERKRTGGEGGSPQSGCSRVPESNRMGVERIGPLLLRFSLPVVAGMLITRFYVLIDGVFVGQAIGSDGMAATTMAMPFVTLLNALVMLIGDGGTAVMALRLGRGDAAGASKVLGNSLFMLAVSSALLALAAPFAVDGVLSLAGATGGVHEQARMYLLITTFGTVSLGFSLGIDTFLRAAGFPNRTLFVQIASALSNIGLDYLFVMVFDWGIVGAASATVLGQVVAMIVTVTFLFKLDMPFRIRPHDLLPSWPLIARIAALGMPSFIVRGSDAAINIVLNYVIVGYGAAAIIGSGDALATVGAISRISQFASVPALGIAVGARPLIGYNHGAGDSRRVRAIVDRAVISGIACLAVLWIGIEAFPGVLVGLFGFEGSSHSFAEWALRISMLALPVTMIRVMGTNYFQGSGKAKRAIGLTFCQQMLLLLPLIVFAPVVLPMVSEFTQLESVFVGMLVADVASTLLVGAFLFSDPMLRRRNGS